MKHSHEPNLTSLQNPSSKGTCSIAVGAFLAVFIGCYFLYPFWPKSPVSTGDTGQPETLQSLQSQKAEFDQVAAAKSQTFTSLSATGAADEVLYSAMREWELAKEKSVLISARIAGLQNSTPATRPGVRLIGSFIAGLFALGSAFIVLALLRRSNKENASAPVTLIEPKVAANRFDTGKIHDSTKTEESEVASAN